MHDRRLCPRVVMNDNSVQQNCAPSSGLTRTRAACPVAVRLDGESRRPVLESEEEMEEGAEKKTNTRFSIPQKLDANIANVDDEGNFVRLTRQAKMMESVFYMVNSMSALAKEKVERILKDDGQVQSQNQEGIEIDGTDGEAIFFRPGIVHRLDKDTTGVMIIPFNEYSHWKIADQFKNRAVQKEYLALTWGEWDEHEGLIENKLSRSKKNPLKYQSKNT